MNKTCNKCGVEKSIEQFGMRKQMKDGRQSTCKSCLNHMAKQYYKANKGNRWKDKNPEKAREVQQKAIRKHRYNISQEEYEALLEKQDYHCALCSNYSDLCIDHDHSTGRVRGLLCKSCNFLLGHIEKRGKAWLSRVDIYVAGEDVEEQ